MDDFNIIKEHYRFTSLDESNLKALKPAMERRADEFVGKFHEYVGHFVDSEDFFYDEKIIARQKMMLKQWFIEIFSGEYGGEYLNRLNQIGHTHVKIKLPAHYVNVTMHFVKNFVFEAISEEFRGGSGAAQVRHSVDKILDINLDVITSAYIEEEKKSILLTKRLESYLIKFADKFSYLLNLLLVLGLVALGIMVLGLFTYDITHIFTVGGDLEKGILATLGSLLMLWVVIELVDTEVTSLKGGGRIAITVFIGVALAAIIRKILIFSLSSDKIEASYSLIATLGVLGIVYWLIAKVEHRDGSKGKGGKPF